MSVRQQALRPIQAPSLFQHGAYFSTSQAASPQSYTKNPTKPTNPPKNHSPSTALSFKKNVISQKIVLFYSANFGGFSSLVYLLSQSHCVYKSKSQKPLNISFSLK
ncbi:MAG: hypothetical protein SPD46_09900 [Sodaliphilus sp.]|nr:hypothetical protein [Sodaliphilus sp.]